MKISTIFTALLCGLLFVACDYESFEEESALGALEEGNAFVRLLTGNATGVAEVEVSEASTSSEVAVESRTVDDNDVTVMYDLGGTAEYGTIYTIEGASQSGGSLLIPFQVDEEVTTPAQADINITFLVDTLMAGSQTIEFTLTGATSADGTPVDVGQGPLRTNLVLTLVND